MQILKEPGNKAFTYNRRENAQIHLDPKGRSSNCGGSCGTGQAVGERGSDSVYFTPSGTPLRELSASPSKSGKNLYSAVYQQVDPETGRSNCNTLPNNSKLGNKSSSRLIKPPFIKTHRKSRSFSFPFMPSYWFGSNISNANDTFSNVQGDISNCDNTDGKLHHVLVEREACGSKDYLDTNGMIDTLEDTTNIEGFPPNLNYAAKNVGLDNFGRAYEECDALLPQCKHIMLNAKENDDKDTKCHAPEECSDDFFRLKNEQNMSPISSSITTTSSNNDIPSSTAGINTETTTSNSELSSNNTKPMVVEKVFTLSKEVTASINGSFLVTDRLCKDKTMNECISKSNYNSMRSINPDESENIETTERLTHKRKSI